MNVYLAGPIFCEGDRMRNEEWSARIRDTIPNINLYNPLENKEINDKTKCASSWQIADGDNARLDETDVLIACIDGDVIPSGTSAEIGKFHEKIARGDKKMIIGICTDSRMASRTYNDAKAEIMRLDIGESQFCYQNLYTVGLIKQGGVLVDNIEDVVKWLQDWEATHE